MIAESMKPFLQGSSVIRAMFEEGKLTNKMPNFSFAGDVFVGTVLLAGTDGEDFTTLPECTEELIELISPQLIRARR